MLSAKLQAPLLLPNTPRRCHRTFTSESQGLDSESSSPDVHTFKVCSPKNRVPSYDIFKACSPKIITFLWYPVPDPPRMAWPFCSTETPWNRRVERSWNLWGRRAWWNNHGDATPKGLECSVHLTWQLCHKKTTTGCGLVLLFDQHFQSLGSGDRCLKSHSNCLPIFHHKSTIALVKMVYSLC